MSLTTKQFEQPTKEWLNLFSIAEVLVSRMNYITLLIIRSDHLNGIITLDEFFDSIKPLYIKNSQLALHTEAAIECLKIVGVKEIEMD